MEDPYSSTGVNTTYDRWRTITQLYPGERFQLNSYISEFYPKPGCFSKSGGSASETVKFKPDCPNGSWITPDDETGTAYIRVYRASGAWTCGDYTLKWGDD